MRDTVWDQVQLAVPSNPELTRDANADVVVVGAGIAGLSVAYNLAKVFSLSSTSSHSALAISSRDCADNTMFYFSISLKL